MKAGLERAQLFQFLAFLQRAFGKPDEPLERLAPVSI